MNESEFVRWRSFLARSAAGFDVPGFGQLPRKTLKILPIEFVHLRGFRLSLFTFLDQSYCHCIPPGFNFNVVKPLLLMLIWSEGMYGNLTGTIWSLVASRWWVVSDS